MNLLITTYDNNDNDNGSDHNEYDVVNERMILFWNALLMIDATHASLMYHATYLYHASFVHHTFIPYIRMAMDDDWKIRM